MVRLFEKVVCGTHAKSIVEKHLSPSQFAYRERRNCTGALLAIQHTIQRYLDNLDC